jgi:hypothetical protein
MRILGLLVAATLAAFSMLATGCGTRSEGQLGRASFAWQGCLFDCGVADNPMAAGGAQANLTISLASGVSFQQIRSSNPSVASFTVIGGSGLDVSAVSAAPGQTQLQLLDGAGKLVDQVTVTVTATAKLTLIQGWTGAAPLVIEGSTQTLHVTTVDASNHTLIGTGSVAFSLSAPLAHAAGALVFGDTYAFTGSAGSGSITARAPSATLVQDVTVVPLAAITGVNGTVQPNSSDANGVYANVDVVASAAGGAVFGATCNWTTSDPSVMLQSQTATSLESAAKASSKFLLKSAGSFTATCTVGSAATTVQLHR